MASINKCLKWVFIVFNALIAVIGVVFVVLARVSAAAAMHKEEIGNLWTVVLFGGFTTALATLGAYGAYKEKKWALILFSVLVCIGMVLCLIGAVKIVAVRPMLTTKIEELLSSDDMNAYFQVFQEEYKLECCGTVNGYKDWGSKIPESCVCPEPYRGTPKCMNVEGASSRYFWLRQEKNTEVYREPCLPLFMWYFNMMLDVSVGVLFGLAILALIGTVMATIMTCQIKEQMAVIPVPTSECSKPPAYDELFKGAYA